MSKYKAYKKTSSPLYYQTGGFNMDFFKNIAGNWKNFMQDPFSNKSQDYLTDLTNRNANINTQRKSVQSQLILPDKQHTTWGDDADRDYTRQMYDSRSDLVNKYGKFDTLTQNQQDELWQDHELELKGGGIFGNDIKLPEFKKSGANFDKDVATRKQLGEVNQKFNNQLMETGAGIASIYSAQKAYDDKPQEKFALDFTNNKGVMRSEAGGGIPTSPLGLYKYPGQTVKVPSGDITMRGINHPVLAIPNKDKPQVMYPEKEYQFKNSSSVVEVPMMQFGGYSEAENNDVDDEDVMNQIKKHEGAVMDKNGQHKAYGDSRGFKTIGYGHLWKPGDANVLTQEQADKLFNNDYRIHKRHAEKIPGYSKATPNEKKALINLTFNMGANWYKKFPKFTKAFTEGDDLAAAQSLRDSKWAKQVGNRSKDVINTFLSDSPAQSNVVANYKKDTQENIEEPTPDTRQVTERAFDFLGSLKQQHKGFYEGLDLSSIYNDSENA